MRGLPVRGLPPQSRRPGTPGPYRVVSPSRAVAVRSCPHPAAGPVFPLGGRLGVTAPCCRQQRLTRRFAGYTRRCGRPRQGPPRQSTEPAHSLLAIVLGSTSRTSTPPAVMTACSLSPSALTGTCQCLHRSTSACFCSRVICAAFVAGRCPTFRRRRGASSWAAALPAPPAHCGCPAPQSRGSGGHRAFFHPTRALSQTHRL